MKTVLVTGAAGFLGHHVMAQFARAGWRVVGVDHVPPPTANFGHDVTYHRLQLPNTLLGSLIAGESPNVCVHCAGSASVGLSLENPDIDFRSNTVLTFEMLEALRCHAPECRFLLMSSAAVYGDPASLPVSEADTLAPLSPYGWHKLQCEMQCLEYSRLFKLPTAVVRIFSAYGPGLKRQVVWDICQRALTTSALTLHGTGLESRDFIHATDIARALVLLAETGPARGDIYNLASGREVTIAELAGLLCNELAPGLPVEFDGRATPGNPLNWRADISKITGLGFVPEITLEEGLREVARWSRKILTKA